MRWLMVDDSHAVGFMGPRGRGTHEHFGVMDRIDIITGTLGKALGGASGGYTTGRAEIIQLLRQRSRPICFPIHSPRALWPLHCMRSKC
jgi:glycine C-acetyltransferase